MDASSESSMLSYADPLARKGITIGKGPGTLKVTIEPPLTFDHIVRPAAFLILEVLGILFIGSYIPLSGSLWWLAVLLLTLASVPFSVRHKWRSLHNRLIYVELNSKELTITSTTRDRTDTWRFSTPEISGAYADFDPADTLPGGSYYHLYIRRPNKPIACAKLFLTKWTAQWLAQEVRTALFPPPTEAPAPSPGPGTALPAR